MVFDLDGVLVDTWRAHARAFADLWRLMGVAGPRYEDVAGRRTIEVIRETLPDATTLECDQLSELKRSQARAYMQCTPPRMPGATDLVLRLHAAGVDLGVATGASRANAEWLLERGGLVDFFSVIVTADDVPLGKPDPMPFREALMRMRALPANSLVVEDSLSGMQSGLEAGAAVVSVHSAQVVEHARFLGAFRDLRALANWLFRPSLPVSNLPQSRALGISAN